MPDFFDRLIARGTQQPGGGVPASGQSAHSAGRASDSSSGAVVTFALPRLPGPFERLAAESPEAFLETADEAWEMDAARPDAARARSALGSLAGRQAGITPPPLLRDSATSRVPGPTTTVPDEQPPARPTSPRHAPLPPGATLPSLAAGAGAAALDQAAARVGRIAADRDQERDAQASTVGRLEHLILQPSPPRMLAVPASAVRAARPAAAGEARTAREQPPAARPVVVRIGRIEVRNTSPDRREHQAKRRAGRAAPKLTLAEYLAAASGGRNGTGVSAGGGR